MSEFSRHYRRNGWPYPSGIAGLLEFARDLEKPELQIVEQTLLWNGLWVSTVWLGIDHDFMRSGPPIIFETMVFDKLTEEYQLRDFFGSGVCGWTHTEDYDQIRYSTELEAQIGHRLTCSKWRRLAPTLRRWWRQSRIHLDHEPEPDSYAY